MTQYLGVIGYPLGHSVSPAFQQAALDHCGLDLHYERWETPAEQLEQVVASLRQSDRVGANVTVPHKQAVIPLLDRLDAAAEAIGAVNTIVREDGSLAGYNTDAAGFLEALRVEGGFEPAGKRALVLGAGGAARAVVYALLHAPVAFLGITSRRSVQARDLRQAFAGASQPQGIRVFVEEWGSESLALALPTYDLVINTTPIGMRHGPAEGESPLMGVDITPSVFVYDLVYNPPETPLLRQAQEKGCGVLGGLPMLVRQGAAAFRLWTGLEPPIEVMRRAAERALEAYR